MCGEGSMHGEGGVHGKEVCMAGGHAWQGVYVAEGHAWQGACMARGHAWQGWVCMAGGMCAEGMHGIGHVWQGGMLGKRDGHCSGQYDFLFGQMNQAIICLINKLTIWNISRKIEKTNWHCATVMAVGRLANLKNYFTLKRSLYWCYREYYEMLCKIMKICETKTYSDKWFSSALI